MLEAVSRMACHSRLKAFNYLNSPLRDKSRSFPKAEGFSAARGVRRADNPQGCSYFLGRHKAGAWMPPRLRGGVERILKWLLAFAAIRLARDLREWCQLC